jgi:hypothetical protein
LLRWQVMWIARITLLLVALLMCDFLASIFYARVIAERKGIHSQARDANQLPMLRADPAYIWDYQPHFKGTQVRPFEKTTAEVRTNSDGLRGPEQPVAFDGDTIIALGDSFTFGTLTEENQIWHAQLARQLSRPGRKVRAINLGMSMATYSQHLLRYVAKGAIYKPLAVVHGIYPPHVQTMMHHQLSPEVGEIEAVRSLHLFVKAGKLFSGLTPDDLVDPEMAWPYLLNLGRYVMAKRRMIEAFEANLAPFKKMEVHRMLLPESVGPFEPAFAKTRRCLQDLAQRLKRAGVRYYPFLIPYRDQVAPHYWLDGKGDERWLKTGLPQERIQKMLAEVGAQSLDLLPAFRAAKNPALLRN